MGAALVAKDGSGGSQRGGLWPAIVAPAGTDRDNSWLDEVLKNIHQLGWLVFGWKTFNLKTILFHDIKHFILKTTLFHDVERCQDT